MLEGKLGLWNQSTQLRFGLRINEGGSFPTFLYTRIIEGKKESIFCENYSLWRGKIDDKNSRCSRSVYTLQHPKWNFSNSNWMWLFPVENSAHLNNTCDFFFQEDVVGEIQGMFSFFSKSKINNWLGMLCFTRGRNQNARQFFSLRFHNLPV